MVRLPVATNGCFADAKCEAPGLGRRAAWEKLERRLRVDSG